MMFYISEYLRGAYHANAGREAARSEILHPSLGSDIAADANRARSEVRARHRIVSASAMARHKNVETLLVALSIVRSRDAIPAELLLIGGWPDPAYEHEMRKRAEQLGVAEAVTWTGHVPRRELLSHYAAARVFCSMSRCESFGIPAVEAQAFGTPVVCSNRGAIPEACGAGGLYVEPDDATGAAKALAELMTDYATWNRYSQAAMKNAQEYVGDAASRPLLKMFEISGRR